MNAAIYLTVKPTGEKLFNGVIMRLDGDKEKLSDLEKAIKDIKAECNAEANRYGVALSVCEIKVKFK